MSRRTHINCPFSTNFRLKRVFYRFVAFCVCLSVSGRVCACQCVSGYVCTCLCMFLCVWACLWVSVRVCACLCVSVRVCACLCVSGSACTGMLTGVLICVARSCLLPRESRAPAADGGWRCWWLTPPGVDPPGAALRALRAAAGCEV